MTVSHNDSHRQTRQLVGTGVDPKGAGLGAKAGTSADASGRGVAKEV